MPQWDRPLAAVNDTVAAISRWKVGLGDLRLSVGA